MTEEVPAFGWFEEVTDVADRLPECLLWLPPVMQEVSDLIGV
jgi:hypothetical protein